MALPSSTYSENQVDDWIKEAVREYRAGATGGFVDNLVDNLTANNSLLSRLKRGRDSAEVVYEWTVVDGKVYQTNNVITARRIPYGWTKSMETETRVAPEPSIKDPENIWPPKGELDL